MKIENSLSQRKRWSFRRRIAYNFFLQTIPPLMHLLFEFKYQGRENVPKEGRGIILASKKYNKSDPVNLGSGVDISIKKLAKLICQLCEFNGRLNWDISKPDGQPKRRLDITKAKKEFDFTPKVALKDGLKKTIEWYITKKKINC